MAESIKITAGILQNISNVILYYRTVKLIERKDSWSTKDSNQAQRFLVFPIKKKYSW